MAHLLAFDQGTTSSRAIIFAPDGTIKAIAQREFPQIFPQPGWVEHDPLEIWTSQSNVAQEALLRAGLSADDIAGIGITNQRETTLLWDRRTGQPVHNAIVWQDRRTADTCARLRAEGLEEEVSSRTGLRLDPYFSATKIMWLLDHVEGVRERAERGELAFGTVDSWLIWRLTQGRVHVTDATNASRTFLYNIHDHAWEEWLLESLNIPRAILPDVVASSGIVGESYPALLGRAVPIAGIAGDQQAALFGQACTRQGMVKNTYGTGCFMLQTLGDTPKTSRHNLVTTVAWQLDNATTYALEGSVFSAGAVVQWLRDGLGIIQSSSDVEALAASVPDNGGVYLVPAFTGLGAPHWDPHARGTLLGITRGTTKAHIARAALESIAFQSADLVAAIQADSGIPLTELRVDGGAAVNDTLMQFQADLLGVPVIRPKTLETTALGAAYLASLATGVWATTADIETQWQIDARFEPTGQDLAETKTRWQGAVERSKSWSAE